MVNRQQRRAQERKQRRSIIPPGAQPHSAPNTHEVIPVPISTTISDYKHGGNRFVALGFSIPNSSATYSLSPDDAVAFAESIIKVARKEVKAEDGIQRVGSGLVIAKELPNE